MVRSLFVSTTFIFVMEPSVELPTRDCVVQKNVDQKKDRATFCLASTWEEYGIILVIVRRRRGVSGSNSWGG